MSMNTLKLHLAAIDLFDAIDAVNIRPKSSFAPLLQDQQISVSQDPIKSKSHSSLSSSTSSFVSQKSSYSSSSLPYVAGSFRPTIAIARNKNTRINTHNPLFEKIIHDRKGPIQVKRTASQEALREKKAQIMFSYFEARKELDKKTRMAYLHDKIKWQRHHIVQNAILAPERGISIVKSKPKVASIVSPVLAGDDISPKLDPQQSGSFKGNNLRRRERKPSKSILKPVPIPLGTGSSEHISHAYLSGINTVMNATTTVAAENSKPRIRKISGTGASSRRRSILLGLDIKVTDTAIQEHLTQWDYSRTPVTFNKARWTLREWQQLSSIMRSKFEAYVKPEGKIAHASTASLLRVRARHKAWREHVSKAAGALLEEGRRIQANMIAINGPRAAQLRMAALQKKFFDVFCAELDYVIASQPTALRAIAVESTIRRPPFGIRRTQSDSALKMKASSLQQQSRHYQNTIAAARNGASTNGPGTERPSSPVYELNEVERHRLHLVMSEHFERALLQL